MALGIPGAPRDARAGPFFYMFGRRQDSGPVTSTRSVEPDPASAGYVASGLQRADSLYGSGPMQYYPGDSYAKLDDTQRGALDSIIDRADSGSPLLRAGQAQAQDTIAGKYLNANPAMSGYQSIANDAGATRHARNLLESTADGSMLNGNPYLDASFDHAAGKVRSAVASSFNGSGRYGSPAMAGALTDGLNTLATDVYGQNYQQERSRQLTAQEQIGQLESSDQSQRLQALNGLGGAWDSERNRIMEASLASPQLANADYTDAMYKLMAGGAVQQDRQQQINADQARWNFQQEAPYQQLGSYVSSVRSLPTGQNMVQWQSKTTNSNSSNSMNDMLGLVSNAAGLYSMY